VDKQQAKFIAEKFLNKFKGDYVLVNRDELPILEQVLYDAGIEFNNTAVKILEKSARINTGALLDLNAPIVYQSKDGSYILEVGYPINSSQAKYYDYVNKGVKGIGGIDAKPKSASGDYKFKYRRPSKKMVLAISEWVKKQGLSLKADKVDTSKLQKKRRKITEALGEAESKKKLAYIISSSIKRDGLKATYYFDIAVKKTFNDKFKESLEEALKSDIVLQIRNAYGNNDK
jgi:hypothetical protein